MNNYYEILGLAQGAGRLEIKTAFRRLAKLYHPDKNPAGKEHFANILKAYEVLSDPVLKSSYDYRLNHQSNRQGVASDGVRTKTWRFDEKEMKRRQYYNEHIKKYARATADYEQEQETKKTYNEYKYVLFATPIAVALFLLIMRLATPSGIKHFESVPASHLENYTNNLKTGDAPYSDFFGGTYNDTLQPRGLTVRNQSGYDVVVCLFTRQRFLKCCFISNGGNCQLAHLPQGPWQLRYSSGLHFDKEKRWLHYRVKGAFTSTPRFYTSIKPVSDKEIILSEGVTNGFERVTEDEFFNTDTPF